MKPTIDIHTHVFRGKDIPLKGFLLSRRYPEWYIRLLAPILFTIITECVRRGGLDKQGVLCGPIVGLVYKYMGEGYRRATEILAMGEVADITAKLVETFEKDGIDLYVPLMIDYEYWFKNTPEPSLASQIDTMYRDVVLPFKGKIHPFVPFDPARELAHRHGLPAPDDPDGGPAERYGSLELVADAIRNKGFIGVKVYNSLGYRPVGNATVDAERRSIFQRNRMARYSQFTGQQFDDVLAELYEFCVKEQVPITAHCLSNGVEAYFEASFDFGKPEYWREVLEEYEDLHLNLAHFGWDHPEGYFPESPSLLRRAVRRIQQSVRTRSVRALSRPSRREAPKTWVAEICDMASQYEYLYTDVAHHSVTVDEDIPKHRTAYTAMCSDFPSIIQKRLLYGTDWHVITRADNFESFKDRYLDVLGDSGIFSSDEIGDFLGGNALYFLGLLPLGTTPDEGWTGNRIRLQSFYEDNHIDPPTWFTSTA